MVIDFTCSTCGENSRIRAADQHETLRCPACGRSFKHSGSSSYDPSRCDDLAIDDEVIGWIARSPGEPTTESTDINTCFSCGYEGSMPYEAKRRNRDLSGLLGGEAGCSGRDSGCSRLPTMRPADRRVQRDRGKTTVCPHCKYFLGCVLQSAKRRFGERRFLGFRLSQQEKTTVPMSSM